MHSLTQLRQIEEIQREMDLEFYGQVLSWLLIVLMFSAIVFYALPFGMEKEIERSEQVLIDACNAGKVSQKYCQTIGV